MSVSTRPQIVLSRLVADTPYYTSETASVTKTATMANGSLLLANNTEAAVADVATVVSIINDPLINTVAVGESLAVAIVKRDAIVNQSAVKFSDVATGSVSDANVTAMTALAANGVIFSEIKLV